MDEEEHTCLLANVEQAAMKVDRAMLAVEDAEVPVEVVEA